MGFTLNSKRKPVFSATPTQTVADLQAAVDFADLVGGLLKGTASERELLTSGELTPGWVFVETDTGRVLLWLSSGWVAIAAAPTKVGTSVIPTPGASMTLTSNQLFTRNGFLLGTIDWALASGTVGHGYVFLTLPAGVRPLAQSFAVTSARATGNSAIFPVTVQTDGVVVANEPPSGRTNGQLRFMHPIAI